MTEPNLKLPILLSITAAVVTIALKTAAWWVTGSVGLLSDAAESVVNLVAAGLAYLALLYAAQPVDREHTYGHEKIEFFSSGLEGGLIFFAALVIAWSAVERLLSGPAVQSLDLGLALSSVAALINLGVARLLLRAGRRHRSIVLEADGQHLMTDVWTSVGVLLGLGLVLLTGQVWLDPVLALLVAANILWTGFGLVRRSFHGLMDRALPDEELARIREVITSHLGAGMAFHALRTRQAGSHRFADFHLLVPGALSVQSAHELADRIEDALRAALDNLEVTIHIEPIEERTAWEDSALLALEERSRPQGR
ncbi:MAG: cation transporter [Planctomycetes bacterium]|nr:cation transporter [Planctomycetota bacterium]